MVEHCEGDDGGEVFVFEWHSRGVTDLDREVRSARALRKLSGKSRIDFQASEAGTPAAQPIRGKSGSWAYFQNLLAQSQFVQSPRQDLAFKLALPRA